MSTYESKITDDHATIRKWVEDRDGNPAMVDAVADKGKGGQLLRINFMDGRDDEPLNNISWDRFFEIFDENNMSFQYQEKTRDGKISRFCKLINKE